MADDAQTKESPDQLSSEQGDQGPVASPPSFVEFEGVKVPLEAFDKVAREKYPEVFSDHENKKKWQAELTRSSQENAERLRKADALERLVSERGLSEQGRPMTELEKLKDEYIRDHASFYPDADPDTLHSYLSKQFDWHMRLAGQKAQESLEPVLLQEGEKFERDFLSAHPKVIKGSEQYYSISDLIGKGVDAEMAYKLVFFDDVKKEALESEIKTRDEDAKRKLQQAGQTSRSGTELEGKTRSQKIWAALEKHGAV